MADNSGRFSGTFLGVDFSVVVAIPDDDSGCTIKGHAGGHPVDLQITGGERRISVTGGFFGRAVSIEGKDIPRA